MVHNIIFLSIKPEYALKIISGDKIVELRRRIPNVKKNDMLIIYSSSPVKSVIGYCLIKKVSISSPNKIWKEVNKYAGISKKDFEKYFTNSPQAYAIYLKDVNNINEPIHLNNIREKVKNFNPPQSYRYVNKLSLLKFLKQINFAFSN